MGEPVAGKFLLEILTKGMYSNPMHVYREYIQNSTDSIDKAVVDGVMPASEAAIHIQIDAAKRRITIHDNGCGIPVEQARETLLNIGHSNKNGIDERGFRGIGRLAGLAYAEEVQFITSASGETVKTVMTCDCVKMQRLLLKTNTETTDVMETFKAISSFSDPQPEEKDKHYFEVRMVGVHVDSGLLSENDVWKYLAETAPIDFDSQKFSQAEKIRSYFEEKGFPITCYKILRGARKLPIYKLYSRSLSTGQQARTKDKDFVRNVEFIYDTASDGKPLYIGWLALTEFKNSISDESIQGIRFRKGNILVGDNSTFAKFFPLSALEGSRANKFFAGEIHVLHEDMTPNSQRDDFEPSPVYNEMKQLLSEWAGTINKKYRRGTSDATNALKRLSDLNAKQKELEEKVNSGAVSSDERRTQIADELSQIAKRREQDEKTVRKALERGTFDEERREAVERVLSQTETASKKVTLLSNKIVNAEYATKYDLPSSYGRKEKKMYQDIIKVIDSFFSDDPQTAERLREAIKSELSGKKK